MSYKYGITTSGGYLYYIVYKTTNMVNGKIYVGVHKTNDLDDGYIGSGTLLRRAIRKYGAHNFVREILSFHENEEEMFLKEKQIVTEEFCLREDTYNVTTGGLGGFYHLNNEAAREETTRKIKLGHAMMPEEKKAALSAIKSKNSKGSNNPMYGRSRKGSKTKPCSEERKLKISKTKTGKITVKNRITGELVGSVDKNHENVLSGLWVSANYGCTWSDEARKRKAEMNKKIGLKPPSSAGLLWWNDGEKQLRSRVCPGEGWVRGRLYINGAVVRKNKPPKPER